MSLRQTVLAGSLALAASTQPAEAKPSVQPKEGTTVRFDISAESLVAVCDPSTVGTPITKKDIEEFATQLSERLTAAYALPNPKQARTAEVIRLFAEIKAIAPDPLLAELEVKVNGVDGVGGIVRTNTANVEEMWAALQDLKEVGKTLTVFSNAHELLLDANGGSISLTVNPTDLQTENLRRAFEQAQGTMVCPDAVIDYTAENKDFPSAVDLQRIERSPKVPEAAQLSDGRESDLPEASLEEAAPDTSLAGQRKAQQDEKTKLRLEAVELDLRAANLEPRAIRGTFMTNLESTQAELAKVRAERTKLSEMVEEETQ